MNTYAIPPQSRGMADVLNEAADSEDRNIESSRRQALTMQQIKSDQQRNQLASEAGVRDQTRFGNEQTRFGYEEDRLKSEKDARIRAENIRKDVEGSAQRHLFTDVANPAYNAKAAPTAVQGPYGTVMVDPNANIPQTIRQPIDLSSRDGLRATVSFLGDSFAARVKHGDMNPEDITKMMAVRKNLEDKGVHDDLLAAFKGDRGALDSISAKMGLPSGTANLEVVLDEKSGIPGVFATFSDGKGGFTKKNVDYLVAALDKGVYDAVVGSGTTKAGAISTVNYQNVHGASLTSNAASAAVTAGAAVTNAAANTSNAKSNAKNADTAAANAGNSGRLITAKIAALNDSDPKDTVADIRPRFYSLQVDNDNKNVVLPSGYSNYGRISGVVQGFGLKGQQANNFAKTEWANLMGEREGAIARLKLQDPTKKYWSKQELISLEDRAMTMLTDDLIKDTSEKGEIFQKAAAYKARRAQARTSALATDKDEQ